MNISLHFTKKTALLCFTILIGFVSFSQSGCWKEIKAGRSHAIAIKNDGTLWSWGLNSSGQLGDGTIINSLNPIQIGTDNNWDQLAAGDYHSFGIKTDGTLWSWGDNTFGQLGTNTAVNNLIPTQVGISADWSKIAVGRRHSMAIKTNGTLWAWGYNIDGTLGDGSFVNKLLPVQIGLENNWSKVTAGYYYTIALKNDNTLWSWGSNTYGNIGNGSFVDVLMPTKIGLDNNWTEITAGLGHSVALKSNGTLWIWGWNRVGQLGSGSLLFDESLVPIQVGTGTNWNKIAAGFGHTIASQTDGSVWAWGFNNSSQIGNGVSDLSSIVLSPIQVFNAIGLKKIAVGSHSSYLIKNDDFFCGWGNGGYGLMGDGTTISKVVPTPILNCGVLSINSENISSSFISVFPNPAYNSILIKSENTPIEKIEVFDLQGRLIFSQLLTEAGEYKIAIEHFEKANYLLKVYTNKGIQNRIIIKI